MLIFIILAACGGQSDTGGLVLESGEGLSSDVVGDTVDESLPIDKGMLDDDTPSDEALNETFKIGKPTTLSKKVFIHYLLWFGEDEHGRHWGDGVIAESSRATLC